MSGSSIGYGSVNGISGNGQGSSRGKLNQDAVKYIRDRLMEEFRDTQKVDFVLYRLTKKQIGLSYTVSHQWNLWISSLGPGVREADDEKRGHK